MKSEKNQKKENINLQIKSEEMPEYIKTLCYLIANGKLNFPSHDKGSQK
jgi:hypothetical protein